MKLTTNIFDDTGGCYIENTADTKPRNCTQGANVPPTVALWGDSIAGSVSVGLKERFLNQGISYLEYTKGGCPPILQLKSYNGKNKCVEYTDTVFKELKERKINQVILVANWAHFVQQTDFSTGQLVNSFEVSPDEMQEKILDTFAKLRSAGIKSIVVYPIPEAEFNVPYIMSKDRYLSKYIRNLPRSIDYTKYKLWAATTRALFDTLGDDYLRRVYPELTLCDPKKNTCQLEKDGLPIYIDKNHLSIIGAKIISPDILSAIME
jgi:hypothetical protein